MRKFVPVAIAIAVAIFLLRSRVFQNSSSTPPSDTPTAHAPPAPTTEKPANTQGEARPNADVPRASDPAVATALDELLAAWEPIQSVYAEVETKMPEAAGLKGNTRGKGKYWLQKKDGSVLIHFDLRNELHLKQGDGTMLVTGEELVTTIDGKHMYSFINQPMHKEASKNKLNYDNVLQIAGPTLIRDLVANNKLSLLPEEMKSNRALKVIKAIPNDGSWETIHYFDKANGIRLEMSELDEKGDTRLHIMLTEIKINPPIGEDQFQPVIPEGVTMEDRTTSQ